MAEGQSEMFRLIQCLGAERCEVFWLVGFDFSVLWIWRAGVIFMYSYDIILVWHGELSMCS